MNPRGYAQQYQRTAVAGAVLNASPHRQVALLLEGCRKFLLRASISMERKDIAQKGEMIQRASAIIAELDTTLNHEAGGEVAASLHQLYDYCLRTLVSANLRNNVAQIKEVDGILAQIEQSWTAIGEPRQA